MDFNYKINEYGDIEFYDTKEIFGTFDIREGELTFFHNELTFAEIEFIYKTLNELLKKND